MKNQAAAPSPAPTAYIHADTTTFKDLVQKLTGGSAHKLRPKAAPFKLQERRKHSVRDLEIIKLGMELSTGNHSPSPQSNAFPSPVKGPATPLGCESVVCHRTGTESPASEEERAIAEKGFYLHASPAGKAEPPVLLTLFPLSSPKQEF